MSRSPFTISIVVLLTTLTLAFAALGQETKTVPSRPIQLKHIAARSLATKPALAKPSSTKPAVKSATPVPSVAQTVPAESAPVQPAAADHQLLGEDEPLPFMRGEEKDSPAEPSSGSLILKSIGALMLVIGLLVFGTWSMKKLGFGNKALKSPNGELGLEVLSTMPMGGGKTLSMVQFGERVLLVGSTAQNFTLLAEHGPAEHSFERFPRSVADLLADDDEGGTFDDELEKAMSLLEGRRVHGGIA